jgi:hypothetical protein
LAELKKAEELAQRNLADKLAELKKRYEMAEKGEEEDVTLAVIDPTQQEKESSEEELSDQESSEEELSEEEGSETDKIKSEEMPLVNINAKENVIAADLSKPQEMLAQILWNRDEQVFVCSHCCWQVLGSTCQGRYCGVSTFSNITAQEHLILGEGCASIYELLKLEADMEDANSMEDEVRSEMVMSKNDEEKKMTMSLDRFKGITDATIGSLMRRGGIKFIHPASHPQLLKECRDKLKGFLEGVVGDAFSYCESAGHPLLITKKGKEFVQLALKNLILIYIYRACRCGTFIEAYWI